MAAKEASKAKTGANAVAATAMILLALVFANIVLSRVFKRFDFTADHVYTLSPASKALVANLPDRLTVKAFISSDLQPPFSQVGQYVRDILNEYANASKGKMVWEVVDPGGDTALQDEAKKFKVPIARRGKMSNTKTEISSSYLGVAFEYQGNIESIPEINGQEGLEFNITSLIKQMTVKKKKIAFATSEGELSATGGGGQQQAPGMQMIAQNMKDYEIVPVSLTAGAKPLGDDVDALVIAGPRTPMSERAKFVIDQFLMKGKAVAFFVDGMIVQSTQQMQIPGMAPQPKLGQRNPVAMDDLLESYGFKINADMILEPRQNAPGIVAVGDRAQLVNYPTFVASLAISDKSPATDHIKGLVFPFTSSVELVKGKQPNLEVTQLASTTPEAWRQKDFFVYDPINAKLKPTSELGPFVLAYAAQGKLKSFFAGKPYPNEKGEIVQPAAANVSLPPGEERPLDESTGPVRMVIVGSSDFLSDEYLRVAQYVPLYVQDLLFAMNTFDYLAQDAALTAIRAKGMASRPLDIKSDSTPAMVKYANIIGVPLLFILFGLFRRTVRNSRRRNEKV